MLPSQRIKLLLEDSKITYTDLEKKTGISKSALQRYASGTTKKIPIDAIEAIAEACGVTAASIMGWELEKPISKDELSRVKKEYIEFVGTLNDEQVRTLLDVAKTIYRGRDA